MQPGGIQKSPLGISLRNHKEKEFIYEPKTRPRV